MPLQDVVHTSSVLEPQKSEDATYESLVQSSLTILQPKKIFAWGLSRATQLAANSPSTQHMSVVTASEEAYARCKSAQGYAMPVHVEVTHKDFLAAYHVPTLKLGMGHYDLVLVQEEYETDATGRDWKRIRAREAFGRAIYNAKGVTHNGSVVVVRVARGWDTRVNRELWRWSGHKVVGECAVLAADMQTVERVVAGAVAR